MKPEWTEGRYGSIKLDLGMLSISVYWDATGPRDQESGYRFSYSDYRSKKFYRDIEEAKRVAVAQARRRLVAALAAIDELYPEEADEEQK